MRFLLVLGVAVASFAVGLPRVAVAAGYEVWVIDQSDTTSEGGGTLYVYQGQALTGGTAATAVPERIDLGRAAQRFCLERTGSAPRRPHMISFNHAHSHAIVSYVTSGHVLFMVAATRTPAACLDVGAEAHAAFPSPDQSHVVVANQNGKLLQRVRTDYARNSFVLEPDATLDLARCRTPSGAPCEDPVLRPDNAPVCPVIDSTGRLTFVTLRGGGLLVVDGTTTPMSILAEYDRATVHPNGCGGAEAAGKMYIRAGGGTAADPVHSDLYAFPLSRYSATAHAPNTPAPALVFSHDDRRFVDGHGGTLTKGGRFLWVGDRFANRLIVVDTATDRVVNEIGLSGRVSSDPAPDILDVAPAGDWIFVSLRGPTPLTMNARGVDNAVGGTPGVGVVRVESDGWRGALVDVAPIRRVVDGVERADPHGLKVRWP
ncbi:MAG: YncE family protein [Candidatus Rokuibacteriota bacterium]